MVLLVVRGGPRWLAGIPAVEVLNFSAAIDEGVDDDVTPAPQRQLCIGAARLQDP